MYHQLRFWSGAAAKVHKIEKKLTGFKFAGRTWTIIHEVIEQTNQPMNYSEIRLGIPIHSRVTISRRNGKVSADSDIMINRVTDNQISKEKKLFEGNSGILDIHLKRKSRGPICSCCPRQHSVSFND
jgi:hypothetical protein